MSGYVFPVIGNSRISSVFGPRKSPGGIGSRNHGGIDIAAPRGSPVVAPIGGTIESAGVAGGYGNLITLRGDDGRQYRFAHLDGFDVRSGRVVAGQQIGRVGSTGKSTGPHLHFEVRDAKGNPINPQGLLDGALKQGKSLVDKGLEALGLKEPNAADVANVIIPGSGTVLEGLGLVGECNWLCQLQNWIKESGFFTRVALGILALIIIAAAVAYFARGEIQGTIAPILKGKIK